MEDIKKMNKEELVQYADELGIDSNGTKNQIIERIKEYIHQTDFEKSEQGDSEYGDPEYEDSKEIEEADKIKKSEKTKQIGVANKNNCPTNRKLENSRTQHSSICSFKDVEESLEYFSGDNEILIKKWVEDFELNAQVFNWSDIQKLIYGKRLLKGSAREFISAESNILSWKLLKEKLLEEFEKTVCIAEVIQQLQRRKKTQSESCKEYLYAMQKISKQVNLDEQSLIFQIIEGIGGSDTSKIILLGATTMKEFKFKLEQYEKFCMKNEEKQKFSSRKIFRNQNNNNKLDQAQSSENKNQPTTHARPKCFICGLRNHLTKDCRFLNPKCFKCNQYGHKAPECKELQMTENANVCNHKRNQNMKDITIYNMTVPALIDTGSSVNLIREDIFTKLKINLTNMEKIELVGLGNNKVETIGSLTADIKIDDDIYNTKIHVVPEKLLNVYFIVGNDILNEANILMNEEGVVITKREKKQNNAYEIMNIEVFDEVENNELELAHIQNQEIKQELSNIIEKYNPVALKTSEVFTKIILNEETPIFHRPRRLSFQEKSIVNRIIQEWLDSGIVQPSNSEFSSPIVLCKKKNGLYRLCIDYRRLNKHIIKDRYPLPLIEDQIDRLQGAKIFTTIDLKNGFFHVPVDPESRKYTSFVVPDGQYEFLKTPFGLCNSPAIFQRFINNIFRKEIREGLVLVYMDDLVIVGKDEKEAIENLKIVLKIAEEHGLEIQWKKCQFLQKSIEYLGHVISNGTVQPGKDKIKAVKNFPRPTTVKQIQQFLGLAGYFRKFVENFSILAKPLSDILRKNEKFRFGQEQEEAFKLLKEVLIRRPVLSLFRFGAETELHTDASASGYGAVLLQKNSEDNKFHPVYYMSHKTSPAEQKYSSYELEVLAVVTAIKKFRIYLQGIKFKIVTDCKAFQMTLNKKDLLPKIARWVLMLEDFDYIIEHRSGNRLKHVDALSRNPIMVIEDVSITSQIEKAQKEDERLSTIMEILKTQSFEDFYLKNNVLYKMKDGHELLVIPRKMQTNIIKKIHEKGHFSVHKVEVLLNKEFYIGNSNKKIKSVINNCIPCIMAERKQGKKDGFLNPIDKGNTPLCTYHIDHLGPMTETRKQYKYIFAVVDGFSKFVWLYPTKTLNANEVIDRLSKQANIFGNPERLISDKGGAFTSTAFDTYCKEEKIVFNQITTGIPRGNGQIERVNRILIPILTKLSLEEPQNWYKHVAKVQMYINSSVSRSIGMTPFKLLTGVEMRTNEDIELKKIIDEENLKMIIEDREKLRIEAQENILKIQLENKKYYDKKRKEPYKYKIGDIVAIKRTQFGTSMKIKSQFLGPYKVIAVKRNDRYGIKKIGDHEGPNQTASSCDNMKLWSTLNNYEESSGSDSE